MQSKFKLKDIFITDGEKKCTAFHLTKTSRNQQEQSGTGEQQSFKTCIQSPVNILLNEWLVVQCDKCERSFVTLKQQSVILKINLQCIQPIWLFTQLSWQTKSSSCRGQSTTWPHCYILGTEVGSNEVQIPRHCSEADFSDIYIVFIFLTTIYIYLYFLLLTFSKQAHYFSFDAFIFSAVLRILYQPRISVFDILGMRINNQLISWCIQEQLRLY